MLAKQKVLVALAALLVGLTCVAPAQAGDARQLVEQYLRDNGVTGGYVSYAITEDYVLNTFPDVQFVAVIFRQYPVAYLVPEWLSPSTLFLVIDGKVYYLLDSGQLRDFFFFALGPVANEDEALDALRTWLRLTQEFVQDLFYVFTGPTAKFFLDVEAEVAYAYGYVEVKRGGRGYISAYLVFDLNGNLLDVVEEVNVKPGPRPICQATKLLDPDRIVRRMAEQALLDMGLLARDYLAEQYDKADAELKKAIDRVWKRILDESR
jgi:hypothetical protein